MSFDDTNTDDFGEAPLPEESNNNRTFMIAVGILGGIILIAVACLGAVYVYSKQSTATAQQADAANAGTATAVAKAFIDQSLTATFQAAILPTTTSTLQPTATLPVAPLVSPTNTPDPAKPIGLLGTQAAATATVGAAYTQAALAAKFTVAPTTTALAGTGIADEYGLPGLVVMALAFVIVILFARRLRIAPEKNR
jgi:type II secretory pathway pseudopilin PulG